MKWCVRRQNLLLNNIAQQHSLKPTVISNSAFGKYNKHNWVQTREWYRAMSNFNTTPRCLSDMTIVQVHQVDWFTAPISRFTGVNGKKRADIICYLADAEGVWLSVDIFSWCEATQLWTGQNSRTFEPCHAYSIWNSTNPQVRECCRFAKTLWLLDSVMFVRYLWLDSIEYLDFPCCVFLDRNRLGSSDIGWIIYWEQMLNIELPQEDIG